MTSSRFPGSVSARFCALLTALALVPACNAHPGPRGTPTATASVVTSTSTTAVATAAPTFAIATTTVVPLPPPPYPVTMTTVALVDSSRPTISRGRQVSATRALTTVVWSPTIAHRWPLVVFAPGYNVGPETYAHLCRAWAAAGFVVASPEFPLADPAVAGAAIDENDLNNEPADVLFVIAALTDPTSPRAAAIDPARIATTGHSDGAEAALAVAQGGNPAIKAVVAMSGQPVVPHVAPNPPLLAIQGDQDTINPPWKSAAVYAQAASPRFLLTLLGGGHLPPFAGGTRWQPVIEAVTIDFLNHYLSGSTTSDAQLRADANRPGLTNLK